MVFLSFCYRVCTLSTICIVPIDPSDYYAGQLSKNTAKMTTAAEADACFYEKSDHQYESEACQEQVQDSIECIDSCPLGVYISQSTLIVDADIF